MEILNEYGPMGAIAAFIVVVFTFIMNTFIKKGSKSKVKKTISDLEDSIKDTTKQSKKTVGRIEDNVEDSKKESQHIEEKIESLMSDRDIIGNKIISLDTSIESNIKDSGFKKKE